MLLKRYGNAVKRGWIKRQMRECFRLCRGDCERGYDFVVVVRPHERMSFAEYQRLFFKGMHFIDKKCVDRAAEAGE